jgi:hypothetical protein
MLLELVGCSSHKYRERPSTRWLRTAASYREPVDQPPAKPANEETSLIGPAARRQQQCTGDNSSTQETAAARRQQQPGDNSSTQETTTTKGNSSRQPVTVSQWTSHQRNQPMRRRASLDQHTGDSISQETTPTKGNRSSQPERERECLS